MHPNMERHPSSPWQKCSDCPKLTYKSFRINPNFSATGVLPRAAIYSTGSSPIPSATNIPGGVSAIFTIMCPDQTILTVNLIVRDIRFLPIVQRLLEGPLSRSEAASLVHTSSFWFSHEFRRIFAIPFRTARAVLRLHLASLFLVVTRARISDIAYWLGYGELKKFSAAFREKFGTSPRKYREAVNDRAMPLLQLEHLFCGDTSAKREAGVCPTCRRPWAESETRSAA